MADLVNLFLVLFAVLDPLGTIPVFMEATKFMDNVHKRKVAIKACVVAFIVLLFFIFVGQIVLESLEIILEAFQISGGVILFLFALTMVFGQSKPETEKDLINDYKHVAVFPVALPSIASPGAIMAVVLLTDNQTYDIIHQLIISAIVLVVIVITCLILLVSGLIQKRFGESGIVIISKVMGLILAAYAAQSILSGIKVFFSL